jgi:RND superfamily putative drug exporter
VREEVADGKTTREAVASALQTAGPTVAAAALILAGTFASLMISGVSSFIQIGFAVSSGIVLSAFLMATMLVPAISAKLGERVWWPGRPVREAQHRARRPVGSPALGRGTVRSAIELRRAKRKRDTRGPVEAGPLACVTST